MTIAETISCLSFYPLPDSVIESACIKNEISAHDKATVDVMQSKEYELTKAECFKWLVYAPTHVSENGVSFQLSDEEKRNFRRCADEIFDKYGLPKLPNPYGYKGSRF